VSAWGEKKRVGGSAYRRVGVGEKRRIGGSAYRRVGGSACPRAWLVGTRSRAIRRSTSDGDVRCSASDGRCTPARPARHVYRTCEPKITEANRKGRNTESVAAVRRLEALYPSFPRSCARVHGFMDVPRRSARERVPTSHTRGHADPPTRRYVSPPRRYADPPIRRHVSPPRRPADTPTRLSPTPTRRPADTPTRFFSRLPACGEA
jgi:hypothetical protein